MKPSSFLLTAAAFIVSASAFAADDSAKIPAPAVTVPPAETAQKPNDLPPCPSETGSRIRPPPCTSVVRSYDHDELNSTGETNLGAALGKLDPSVNYRNR